MLEITASRFLDLPHPLQKSVFYLLGFKVINREVYEIHRPHGNPSVFTWSQSTDKDLIIIYEVLNSLCKYNSTFGDCLVSMSVRKPKKDILDKFRLRVKQHNVSNIKISTPHAIPFS